MKKWGRAIFTFEMDAIDLRWFPFCLGSHVAIFSSFPLQLKAQQADSCANASASAANDGTSEPHSARVQPSQTQEHIEQQRIV